MDPIQLFDSNNVLVDTFSTIQDAIDFARNGDRIVLADGVYVEQLVINDLDNFTIEAAPGADVTIQAPADLVETGRSASDREIHSVVTVTNGSNVVLQNITVDGAGAGNTVSEGTGAGTANFYGIFYRNASGGLENVDVTGVRDPYASGTAAGGEPIVSGAQRGVAVVVDNDPPAPGGSRLGFSMTGGTIDDFQKNATVFSNADLDITGVTVTGGGAQTIMAQNGFQVSGCTGTIAGNTLTGIGYAGPASAYSGAVLAFGNTDLDIVGNTITGSNADSTDAKVVGIYVLDFGTPNSGGSIAGNTISHVDEGIDISGNFGPDGILVVNNEITDVDLGDAFATGVWHEPSPALTTAFDVDGSAAGDRLSGAAGDDTLSGLGGDDSLDGNGGNDQLDGGEGTDTVSYAGSFADYVVAAITDANGRVTGFGAVTDGNAADGDEGSDALSGVEVVQFGDLTLDATDPVQLFDDGGNLIGTFGTIQGAVDAAGTVAGAVTILVGDGNFSENVVIDRGDLTLVSANGRDATTITGVAGGALGAIEIDPGVNNVTIGGTGHGFTVIGLDGNGAVENGAIYLQGAHDGITLQGNNVVANGDAGLTSEYGHALTNILIDGNEFSGQTFAGAQPGGSGFGEQFDVGNNVPRQLVVLGSGNGGAVGSNVVFSNNLVSGTAGGTSSTSGLPFGNSLVTIDVPGSVISGNLFTGTTSGNGYALRARSIDTDITDNIFDDGLGQSHGIFVNNGGVPGTYSGNAFHGGGDADVLWSMTDGADLAHGGDGADLLMTGRGNDMIVAGADDDIVGGGAGSDTIDGGAGADTSAYAGSASGYLFTVETDASGRATQFLTVVEIATGDADVLTGVERLDFGGGATVLDLTAAVQLFDGAGNLVGTFDTIQGAVDGASDGFTIRAGAGTYDEDLVIDVSVTILGADAGTPGFGRDASDGTNATNIIGHAKITAADGVTIDGVRFVNDATTTAGGPTNPTLQVLTGGGASGHSIVNSVFWSSVAGGASGVDDRAIALSPIADGSVTITDNIFSGASHGQFSTASWGRAIWFDGGGVDLAVTGNLIEWARTAINLDMGGDSTANVSGNGFLGVGTGVSVGVDTDGLTLADNDHVQVGTDFNFRNFNDGVTFNAEDAVDALVPYDPGNDPVLVLGGSGDDDFTGTSGTDILDGNNSPTAPAAADADTLDGAGGNDLLLGRGGDDSLTGGAGDDSLDGGAGTDTAHVGTGAAFTANGSNWTVTSGDGSDVMTGVEVVSDGATTTLLVGSGGFATIQAAIDAANPGDTILVAAGNYGAFSVDKAVTIEGLGEVNIVGSFRGDNGVPAGTSVGEWLQTATSYNGAAGAGATVASDGVTLSNLNFTGFLHGVSFGDSDGLTLAGVDVSDSVYGVVKLSGGVATGFTMTGGSITDSYQGFTIDSMGGTDAGFDTVLLDGVRFEDLTEKGFYADHLSNAQLLNLVMTNVGEFGRGPAFGPASQTGEYGAGIDINVKFGDYSNIDIGGFDFTNVGSSSHPDAVAGDFGAAITIKARDDGPTYGGNPATLDNVTVHDGTIDGTSTGIRIGEPGKGNAGPTNVTVDGVEVANADVAMVDNASQAVLTVTGTASGDGITAAPTATGPIAFTGAGGADVITGGGGRDTIDGGTSADQLNGAGGDDRIIGGAGNDIVDGGAGVDTAVLGNGVSYVATPLGWIATSSDGTDILMDVEIVEDGSGARTLLVGAGGFDTIQAAIDAAQAGDTIKVAAGTYDEDLVIDVAVTIVGADAGTPATGRDPANGGGATNIVGHAKVTAAEGVTIDGIRFVNDATTTAGGPGNPTLQVLTGGGASGHQIVNSVFWSAVAGGANGVDDRAIALSPIAGGTVTIAGNLFSGASHGQFSTASWGRAIWSDGGGVDLVVTGNRIEWTRSGVNLDMSGDSTASVSGNSLHGLGTAISAGIDLDGVTLSDNDISLVGTEFNFRNLTAGITFDAAAAVGTLTPADPANDLVVILGGSGGDSITGTAGADYIDGNNNPADPLAADADTLGGGDGNDTLLGRGGDDVLDGGAGDDLIDGGAGADTASYAGAGSRVRVNLATTTAQNTLGAGNDTLAGIENVIGTAFADVIEGGAGANLLEGGEGDDRIWGNAGNDGLTGGSGDDLLDGGDDSDTLAGAAGSDRLVGGAGDDDLDGGDGADILAGGTGNDGMTGGAGNDVLSGNAGDDHMAGGTGDDVYTVEEAGDVVTEAAGEGYDTVRATIDHVLADNVEELRLLGATVSGTGSASNNNIYGNGAANQLHGMGGNDLLSGVGGDDDLFGDDGNDLIYGGAGGDLLDGGEGNDDLVGGAGTNSLLGGGGNDRMTGGSGADLIQGGDGDDWGGGANGADTLGGGEGNDTLFGGAGIDLLSGGGGDDVLAGGTQQDTLTGDAGADRFVFNDGELGSTALLADRITDFDRTEGDRISLFHVDANEAAAGDQGFAWIGSGAFTGNAGELRFQITGPDIVVQGDTDGDGLADLYLRLEGALSIGATDFIL